MKTTTKHDLLNRVDEMTSTPGAAASLSDRYYYNSAGQRWQILRARDGAAHYLQYQYDTLGQVTSGKRYANGVPLAGQQFEYGFDTIGNRKFARSGGDTNGANLRQSDYTANLLNQYSQRTVPGYVQVLGEATNLATVTVNKQATTRQGSYYHKELTVGNGSNPVWQGITNFAVLNQGTSADIIATNIGNLFVAQTPESFQYDLDGNLTNDGRWMLMWDGENRLVKLESQIAAPTASKFKLEFTYDAQGRRIQKLVSTNSGSSYVAQSTNRFVYDGWNLLATLDPQLSTLNTFTWGLDLSGTMQGAGGVGGLLAVGDASTINNQSSSHFAAYDGNGNVMALVNAADGKESARYEYGPFGELIRATGPMAKANPFRFSTKYQDDETDQLYYGYRFFNASLGRWPSRDPIGEAGFTLLSSGRQPRAETISDEDLFTGRRMNTRPNEVSLYAFVLNDPQNRIDPLGLLSFEGCSPDQQQQIQNDWNSFCQQVKSSAFKCCLNHFNIPQRLAAMCDRADTKIVCHASNTGTCQDTCGWTLPFGRTIHLCPLGLSQDPGCGPLGCTLLHEMTHLAGHWREKWADRVENCLQGCPQRPTH